MANSKAVNIQDSIEEAISKTFSIMLEKNKDDLLLKELIRLQKNNLDIKDLDLDAHLKKLEA